MKKLFLVLLAVLLAFTAGMSCTDKNLVTEINRSFARGASAAREETPAAQPAENARQDEVDYDAIYALHEPDEIVMTIDGQEICWEDYFYAYSNIAKNLESQFQTYQAYGVALGWNSQADEEGHTYAELFGSKVEMYLRRFATIDSVAEENGVALNEEEEAAVQEIHRETIAGFVGEDGTEEQLFEMLSEQHLRPEMYWKLIRNEATQHAIYRQLFGENDELVTDQQALDWMKENGIVSADHILISTRDPETSQSLDEAGMAEKAALAQQLAEELRAIEDPAEREARFLELKAEYGEDPGAAEGGYVFGSGVMEDAFYQGALALEEGQVSEPVQTRYGYHILLRHPLQGEDMIFTGSGKQSAKSLLAGELFSQKMEERYEAQKVEYVPDFEAPSILDFKSGSQADK